ncbi:hypothetical protein XENOCAPTIV_005197 [Xenoophorus captivus]|uniref:Zinc finger AN1-type containing 4 n=1 Tax=Xenoophorus captivus TaxID=1517983 RepID=A0ABV0Q4I1_9TELE
MTNRKDPPFFNDDSVGAFQYKLPFYDTMELFIETLTGTCFELRVLPFEAVVSVKAKIQRLEESLLLLLSVTLEDPVKDVADLMESTKEEGWDKNQASKQVTFVVYREGDQLSFFRVVDRGDGTLTPLSESLSGGSLYNVYTEEDGESSAAAQHCLENSITMTKMKLLKAKMEDMNLNKKEEEPWEACPSFAKIRSPPKVSRMDIGSRLMKDCVYPQLPPLCTRGTPESPFEPVEPSVEAVGLSILEEPVGLVVPAQPGTSFGELSDPLSLDMSIQHEGGHQTIDVGAQHQLSHSPWTLGTSDTLTSRADGTQLGTSVHISPPCPLAASPSPSASTRLLSQPFDSTLCIQANLQAQSLAKPGNISPHPPASLSTHSARLRGVKVESPGKRPELISKREARGITKMVNQAYKEPLGSLSNSELFASLSTRAPDSSSIDNLGESLGFAQTLPPSATASAHSGLGSRLPSIPTNKFLQDDLFRPMSPLRRAAASYRVSSQNH